MATPGRWFKIFLKNEQRRLLIFTWYVHWKAIYEIGHSEVGFFWGLFSFQSVAIYYLVAEQWAKKIGVEISMENIALFIPLWFLSKLILYISVGIFWDKSLYIQLTQEWHNKRNIMLQEIKKQTKEKNEIN